MHFLRELAQLSRDGASNPSNARAALHTRFAPAQREAAESQALAGSADFETSLSTAPAAGDRATLPGPVSPPPRVRGQAMHHGQQPTIAKQAATVPQGNSVVLTPMPVPRESVPSPGTTPAYPDSVFPAASVAGRAAEPLVRADFAAQSTESRAQHDLEAGIRPPLENRAIARNNFSPRMQPADFVQQASAAAPLSEEAVASRQLEPVASQPVIHVTIDRIEVRAPAAPAPRARASAAPSVSLSEYLRRGKHAGGAS